jgi:hypothetical protein
MTQTQPLAKGKRITGQDREKLAKDLAAKYGAGASVRELADEIGRSYAFTHRILTEHGVELRPRGGANRKGKH